MCRREEPNSSSGSHATGPADQERSLRHDDARLPTEWDHDLVRGFGSFAGACGRPVLRTASPPRTDTFPAASGPRIPRRCPLALGDGQRWHAPACPRANLAEASSPFRPALVPTSSSRLNLIERWFGELTNRRIRRGSLHSVEDLEKAIAEFLAAWNEKPKSFVWTAAVELIIEKLSRCRQTLEKIEPQCTLPRKRKAKK